MRKHIFRAMLKSGGWLYWNEYGELTTENGKRHAFEVINRTGKHLYYYVHELRQHIKAETVGMQSGLSDKNGTKIFEGDIIRHYNIDELPEEYEVGRVFFSEEQCCFKRTCNQGFGSCYISDDCKYEVIGNIHDNPELLEVSE